MDIDFLKSSPEDQLDMMMMMMQMDKFPDFSETYTDTIQMPSVDFTQGSNSSNTVNNIPQIMENHHTAVSSSPPSFLNFPSTISGGASGSANIPNQESPPTTIHFLSNYNTCGKTQSHQNNKNNSSMAAMREMIFRMAAMQPIHIDPESVKPPKRRNVRISKDPQSVAARHRRERISERIRILQRLVPGGTKMDTSSMLDEAIHYVKFLKNQVQSLERAAANGPTSGIWLPVPVSSGNSYFSLPTKLAYQTAQDVQQYSYSGA